MVIRCSPRRDAHALGREPARPVEPLRSPPRIRGEAGAAPAGRTDRLGRGVPVEQARRADRQQRPRGPAARRCSRASGRSRTPPRRRSAPAGCRTPSGTVTTRTSSSGAAPCRDGSLGTSQNAAKPKSVATVRCPPVRCRRVSSRAASIRPRPSPSRGEQDRALRGELHAARQAPEQGDAEARLEMGDALADRRLGGPERRRRPIQKLLWRAAASKARSHDSGGIRRSEAIMAHYDPISRNRLLRRSAEPQIPGPVRGRRDEVRQETERRSCSWPTR